MFNIAEYQKRPTKLADYLPWALLVAPGTVLNKDGSFQRTAKYRGPDLDSATPSELISVSARINDILKRFGSGWALNFEADRHEIKAYPKSKFPDAASWLVDEERRASFEQGGMHFDTGFYLTLSYLPPEDRTSKAERMLLVTPDGNKDFTAKDHLSAFTTQTDRAFDLFASILPQFSPLDDAATLTYLHGTISTKSHSIVSPEIPMHLDAVLADCPLTGGLEPMLGDEHLRILTILSFPGTTSPGILDALNRLGIAYRWSTRFIAMDKPEAIKALSKYRRQWFAKRKSVMALLKEVVTNEQSVLVDTDADNKALDADEALQELGGKNPFSDASGWRGIAIAWIGGIITPGGSIVGLPIVASLYNAGVGTAVLMTYATSLATLSMLRIPLEIGFYGWKLTVLRVSVSLILPLIAGGLTLLATRVWEIR